ncbi:hypothetical protein D3C73_1524810 [compost metagenome]
MYFTALNTRLEKALRNSDSLPLRRRPGAASRVMRWLRGPDSAWASLMIAPSRVSTATGWLSDG